MAIHTRKFRGGLIVEYDDVQHTLEFIPPTRSSGSTNSVTIPVGGDGAVTTPIGRDDLSLSLRNLIDQFVPFDAIDLTADGDIVFSTSGGQSKTYSNPVDSRRYLPSGGTAGQLLGKDTDSDYDVSWKDDQTGTGGGTGLSSVAHDETLKGTGTSTDPLGLADSEVSKIDALNDHFVERTEWDVTFAQYTGLSLIHI